MEQHGQLPGELSKLCDEFGLEPPMPGEQWEFELGDLPVSIGRRLKSAGCELRQEHATDEGRYYEYVVPEPGWPDPLGYVTTDEPEWVGPQHGWNRRGGFRGNVRGTIPDPGDCDRHPDLPPDAYALSSVHIYAPDSQAKFRARTSLKPPEGSWAVNLTYEQVNHGRSQTAVYSSELGEYPECTEWRSLSASNDERRRVEFFDTAEEAVEFVEEQTGLNVPTRSADAERDHDD